MKHNLCLPGNLRPLPIHDVSSSSPVPRGSLSHRTPAPPQRHSCQQSHLLKTVTLSRAYGKGTIWKVPLSSFKSSGTMPRRFLMLPRILPPCQIISSRALVCPYSISDAHLARSCPTSAPRAQLLHVPYCRLFRQVSSLLKQWLREDYFHACETDAKKEILLSVTILSFNVNHGS